MFVRLFVVICNGAPYAVKKNCAKEVCTLSCARWHVQLRPHYSVCDFVITYVLYNNKLCQVLTWLWRGKNTQELATKVTVFLI